MTGTKKLFLAAIALVVCGSALAGCSDTPAADSNTAKTGPTKEAPSSGGASGTPSLANPTPPAGAK